MALRVTAHFELLMDYLLKWDMNVVGALLTLASGYRAKSTPLSICRLAIKTFVTLMKPMPLPIPGQH